MQRWGQMAGCEERLKGSPARVVMAPAPGPRFDGQKDEHPSVVIGSRADTAPHENQLRYAAAAASSQPSES
jgi:hypothetical protein